MFNELLQLFFAFGIALAPELTVALSLSLTHKAVAFDRRMPEIDFDSLDPPGTGTLPVAMEDGARQVAARNRQQPRTPIQPHTGGPQ